jgi:hypothetical protein
LFLCGINGVGGGDNVGFIDFVDAVGKHFFGDPLLVKFMIFAVLTTDEPLEFDFISCCFKEFCC